MARKRIRKNIAYDSDKKLFYVFFDYGTDQNGRRVRKSRTFATEEEARRALLQFETQQMNLGPAAPEGITVEKWLNYWLEDIVRPNRAYTSYYCYRNMIWNHIVPELGSVDLRELTPYQIQQYYTRMMREKGLGPNTVHKHHILLHTALKTAFRQDVLAANPVDRVEPPQEVPAKRVFYTPAQLKELFRCAEGTPLEIIVKLAGYLGLRRGEICGLRWDAVDLERKVIIIRLARTTAGNQVVEKGPKTQSSVRELGISGLTDLIALLRRTKREQERRKRQMKDAYTDSGYVVTYRDGRPWKPNEVTRRLEEFVRANDLPHITVHGLRHTFASVANSANVPLLDIGRALGHKDISITGRIYTHLFDETHSKVLKTVAGCIRDA